MTSPEPARNRASDRPTTKPQPEPENAPTGLLSRYSPVPEASDCGFRVRPGTASDFPLVHNAWLNQYRYSGHNVLVPIATYREAQDLVIKRLLGRAAVAIAHPTEDPDAILGFLVWEPLSDTLRPIHFTYVKEVYRNRGIAKALLKAANIQLDKPLVLTHPTRVCRPISARYRLVWMPELAL